MDLYGLFFLSKSEPTYSVHNPSFSFIETRIQIHANPHSISTMVTHLFVTFRLQQHIDTHNNILQIP